MANVLGNFTNICYSLALRHQLYQCFLNLNVDTLPGEELETGAGIPKKILPLVPKTWAIYVI